MPLVRVFGNTYLNPNNVGKLELQPTFGEGKRTNVTTVYDVTGQNVLLRAETTVAKPAPDNDLDAVARDNHAHAEIIAALISGRDALPLASATTK
ncbi:hypothetical protein PO883_31685 [Massilia sp. DJPM01]|uniref:hypothetical protein n=1 Tax=Massilia sp. DJPM01 TaxID=3024404 RepID=UPI00259F05AB|nr:hypothetical protein [Massilia sp. DJPM01]MDM5181744.1 hypothetical protein [Massilia sp. DJPM01]